MRTLLAVIVLGLVPGCSKKADAPAAPPKPVEPPKPPVTPPEPPKPAGAPADDASFRTAAADAATQLGKKLVSYGTAELDDKPGPERWAVLMGTDDGSYLVQAGDTLSLVTFDADGRTTAWNGASDKLVWEVNPDKAIKHQQTHRAGYERYAIALRSGAWVVLGQESLDDARIDEQPAKDDYADASGACTKPCPKATERDFKVVSAPTLAALIAAAKPR